jgi:hypothetical protein
MSAKRPAPNWRDLVRKKLACVDLDPSEFEEIAYELATHVEDLYERYREEGLSESEAVSGALNEVSDWRELGHNIRRARQKEKEMNQRTKVIWIPGLVTIALASGVLALLQLWDVRPHIVWMRSGLALLFYVPWLVAQPVFGAIGAYLSRRVGGNRNERLLAGIFPSIAMLLTFSVMLAIGTVLSIFGVGDRISTTTFIGLGFYIALWVIVPGLALGLGALPFLGEPKRRLLA